MRIRVLDLYIHIVFENLQVLPIEIFSLAIVTLFLSESSLDENALCETCNLPPLTDEACSTDQPKDRYQNCQTLDRPGLHVPYPPNVVIRLDLPGSKSVLCTSPLAQLATMNMKEKRWKSPARPLEHSSAERRCTSPSDAVCTGPA